MFWRFSARFKSHPLRHAFAVKTEGRKNSGQILAEVKNGHVRVPVTVERTGVYTTYRVTWHADGTRKRKGFADQAEAMEFAKALARDLSASGGHQTPLTGKDRLTYLRARDVAKRLGVPLDAIVDEYSAARTILGAGSLLDACRAYAGHKQSSPCPAMPDLVREFIKHKEGMRLSEDHVQDLRKSLARFVEVVRVEMPMVRPNHVEDWLGSMQDASPRSRRNRMAAVRNLVSYCERRGYLPKGSLDLSVIEFPRGESEVQIYTPTQLRKILASVRPSEVPFVAIGAFSGMRSAEITRLRWEDIKPDVIDVRARNAKTRQRRLVPILPALAAWLREHRQEDGPVCPLHDPIAPIGWRVREAGVQWLHNGLRHSFGSYRMALVKNEAQVALEMGNSPAMVFRHYRAVVTEERAREWFDVVPQV